MLAQLSTLKSRLAILDSDTTYDALLTSAIKAISARFDRETHRTLARTVNASYEFPADDTEISLPCYPIESVSKFELKTDESTGWIEQPAIKYLVRLSGVVSLNSQLCTLNSQLARATYTGGFVLPGATPGPGQTPLPDDLQNAALEQLAFWFKNREKTGLRISWPSSDEYRQFATYDLLHSVVAVLRSHQRLTL